MDTGLVFSATPDVDRELLAVLLAFKRELSDDELVELSQRIRPVVRDYTGQYFYIEPVDPRNGAFTWCPIYAGDVSRLGGIVRISTIYTLHSFGYPGFFKPSVAEVLSMIPQHLLNKVSAFETIGPSDESDLTRQEAATNAGYHVAVTHLYV